MLANPAVPAPRILLIGFGPTTLSALEGLVERFEVIGLVRSSEGTADSDHVICRARSLGVAVYPEGSLSAIEGLVERLRPDAVVISSYHRVLPARIVARCRFINVHYALLPRYRGRANVNWAILNGEEATGISIHVISPNLDAGNILYQERMAIAPSDTITDLYERLNTIQRRELAAAVAGYLNGNTGQPQDEEAATYCCSRNPEDGHIDWSTSALQVYNLVRALTPPYPGAFTYFEGKPLLIWRAEVVSEEHPFVGRIPGRVVRTSRAQGTVDVLTGTGTLRLVEVQRPGEHRRPAAEVITSVRDTLGLRGGDLLARIDHLERRLAGQTVPQATSSATPERQ